MRKSYILAVALVCVFLLGGTTLKRGPGRDPRGAASTGPVEDLTTASITTFYADDNSRLFGGVVSNFGAAGDVVWRIEDGFAVEAGMSVTLVHGAVDNNDIEFCVGSSNEILPDTALAFTGGADRGVKQTNGQRGDFIQLYAPRAGDLRVLGIKGTWTEQACSS